MSKYTMELRELFEPIRYNPPLFSREVVEGWFKDYELSDYLTAEQIAVVESGTWSKDKLAKKIVDHYYMREIGYETIGLFIHEISDEMNELMEEYLPLIYSSSIAYDPLVNVDVTETFGRTMDGGTSGSSSSSSSGSSLGIYSDTPQGGISGLESNTYLTNATKNSKTNSHNDSDTTTYNTTTTDNGSTSNTNTFESDTSTATTDSGANNTDRTLNSTYSRTNERNTTAGTTEDYIHNVVGNNGMNNSESLMKFRETFLNIDRQIINEFSDLFFGLW